MTNYNTTWVPMDSEYRRELREWGCTSAGTMGAFNAVAASSPFNAPITASAISIATPSYETNTPS